MRNRKAYPVVIATAAYLALTNCGEENTEENGDTQQDCEVGTPYIVTELSPYSWEEDTDNTLTLRCEGKREKSICIEGDNSLRSHTVGERVYLTQTTPRDNECLTQETLTITPSLTQPNDETVTCTVSGSIHILEYLDLSDWEFEGITIAADKSDGEWLLPIKTWWEVEVPEKTFENPNIVGTGIEDETEVNIYEYVYSFPETLVNMLFCGEQICQNDFFEISFWNGPTAFFLTQLDCARTNPQ